VGNGVALDDGAAHTGAYSSFTAAADELAEHMGLRANGTRNSIENRRDKQVQQEAVQAAGLRSVRSVCDKAWEEVKARSLTRRRATCATSSGSSTEERDQR
jgi:hypothetical protein